ncbi:hypothetical protein MASR2M70_13550 [Bacillota bacterium]
MTNKGAETGKALKEISSEIIRTTGSWLTETFNPGDVVQIAGTAHNNGYFEIKEISLDGKEADSL